MSEECVALGRPTREAVLDREGLPPPVVLALQARASGNTWAKAAEIGGLHVTALREWRKLPACRQALDEMVRDNVSLCTTKLTEAMPKVADELIDLALDKRLKAYSRVSAMALLFQTVAAHLLDAGQREEMTALREQLDRLEQCQAIDV